MTYANFAVCSKSTEVMCEQLLACRILFNTFNEHLSHWNELSWNIVKV